MSGVPLQNAEAVAKRVFGDPKKAHVIWRLARQNKIPKVNLGSRRYLFDPDAIEAWIARGGSK